MKNRAIGIGVVAVVLGGLITSVPVSVAASEHQGHSVRSVHFKARVAKAPKPGRKCKAKQKGRTVGTKRGATLRCVKVGKKLVWKKVSTATPTAIAAAVPAAPPVPPVPPVPVTPPAPVAGPPTSSTTADDVHIVTAGDIACSPNDVDFNSGLGQNNRCLQKYTADLIASNIGSYFKVLALGDNQYHSGSLSHFLASYEPSWGQFKSITAPVVGNHEYVNSNTAADYFTYFNGSTNGVTNSSGPAGTTADGWYSYNTGASPTSGWHIVALNSQCAELGADCGSSTPQFKWLAADLAASTKPCTLAYWHHPRFSSTGQHGFTELAPLWDLLYQNGADVVLNGHNHNYERFAPQNPSGVADPAAGIREFIVGTGGKDLNPFGATSVNSEVRAADSHGVLDLNLRANSYAWNFLPATGTSTDTGTTTCH